MPAISGPSNLVDAACFYARELGIAGLDFELDIRLEEMCEDVFGVCHPNESTDLEIRLNNDRAIGDTLTTLAHEMVHVKQFVKCELVEATDESEVMWKGQTFHKRVVTYEDYISLPWEVEAHARQEELYNKFMRSDA